MSSVVEAWQAVNVGAALVVVVAVAWTSRALRRNRWLLVLLAVLAAVALHFSAVYALAILGHLDLVRAAAEWPWLLRVPLSLLMVAAAGTIYALARALAAVEALDRRARDE